MNDTLLADTLEIAVPLWLQRLEQWGGPLERDWEWAGEFAWVLGSEADKLLYRSEKKGETARLFNDLARAIAIMAHAPGGVQVFGRRWEVSSGQSCGRRTAALRDRLPRSEDAPASPAKLPPAS